VKSPDFLRARVRIAGHYRLSLVDVNSLKLWQMNALVADMNKEQEGRQEGRSPRGRPPGSTPIMT